MNDAVHVDKASLDALTETLRVMAARVATLEAENAAATADNAKLRAILAQHGLATADEATEPEDAHGG
jgi:hypothetical protein